MAGENVLEFQFHKGAIRTIYKVTTLCYFIVFQFHKGAIRTFDCS